MEVFPDAKVKICYPVLISSCGIHTLKHTEAVMLDNVIQF